MVLRLLSISSGRIWFDELDISTIGNGDVKAYYRKVQGVFQDPFSSYNPIFKSDRIFEILHREFYPAMKEEEWRGKVIAAIESVCLHPESVLNKYPHQLSGGQLQRFLITRALLLDIQVLVADEIISMLDASTRIEVLDLLADLKFRGLSILFITHDLSLANYISERSVILYRGCIAEIGATEKIFANPLHPYTKMLLDSVPRLDKKWEKGQAELKTTRSEATGGCAYYDRCPVAQAKCASYRPGLTEILTDHSVACIHYEAG